MGVIEHTLEIAVRVSPIRLIKAFIGEPGTVLPRIMCGAIKSSVVLHGNGTGPGTIFLTSFSDGKPVPCAKHRIDALDTEKGNTRYTMIEGAELGDKIESIVYNVKFEEVGDGERMIKLTIEYHTKGDILLKDDDEDIKQSLDHIKGFYTAAEEYLNANPNVFA